MTAHPETSFQTFHQRTTPGTGPARLDRLRTQLREAGLDAFLVPRADAHQGEYVAPSDERLAWLTSFTGSAGLAVVTVEDAALFVDGRYTLQAANEVATGSVTILRHPEDKPTDWLAGKLEAGSRVGFDPWLHTAGQVESDTGALAAKGMELVRTENLVDRIWDDRPAPPGAPLVIHSEEHAGRSSAQKRAEIAAELAGAGQSACVLTLPDSIAWLQNVRGSDIPRVPVALAFAILARDGSVRLFVEPSRCDAELRAHLGEGVSVEPPANFAAALGALSGKVRVDKATAPVRIADLLEAAGATLAWGQDPCILRKARKTETEIAGARAAHLRDGAAMARFLAWVDAEVRQGGVSEIDVVLRLEAFRRETGCLRDISFETICGSGPNGAIVHYRVSEASNRVIAPGDILLVDSGGQYADGTTDITRTIATGEVPDAASRAFTLVLKGLIAMSRLRWPPGLTGRDIDCAARAPLWRAGLDYDHGTGHGVGSYLSVHEGPQSLSRRSTAIIEPGMILSIEPGYYRPDAFGIRIENLAFVHPPHIPEGGDRPMLGFETLTFAPIDRRLINLKLLDSSEIGWLNEYHAGVLARIGPLVDDATRKWLIDACSAFEPVARSRAV